MRSALRFVFISGVLAVVAESMWGSPISPTSFTEPTFINFDNLIGGNCNLCGPSVTTQYASQGVTFNNPSYPGQDTADTNLTPLFSPPASLPNALFVEQGGMIGDQPAAPFQILFSVPVTMAGFDFGSSTDASLQLTAYGAGGTLLETLTFTGSSANIGLAGFAGLQESTPITELAVSYILTGTSRTLNFSIDNLEFQGPSGPASAPEPGYLLLVASGLCVIGLIRKRRPRS